MGSNAEHVYLETSVMQADPMALVKMLYRAAIDSVSRARMHLTRGEIRQRSLAISKAQEILSELAQAVDQKRGGDLAVRLLDLYDYMGRRLQEANFSQVEPPLVEVERLMTTLLEGWEMCPPPADSTARAVVPAAPIPAQHQPTLGRGLTA